MADLSTPDNKLDPVGAGYHPPQTEEDGEWQGGNHGLLKLRDTKDDSEGNETTANLGKLETQTDSEKPRHVGFWHHDMVNVRLHVIKLWARTGENVSKELHDNTRNVSLTGYLDLSAHSVRIHTARALALQRSIFPHPRELLVVNRLRGRF